MGIAKACLRTVRNQGEDKDQIFKDLDMNVKTGITEKYVLSSSKSSSYSTLIRSIDEPLTVSCNGSTLEQLEAILSFPSRDLAMRELGKKFRLLVALIMGVLRRELDRNSSKSCGGANLQARKT
jgi:hypothetical protein